MPWDEGRDELTPDELLWCEILEDIIHKRPEKVEFSVAAEHGIVDIYLTDGPPGAVYTIFTKREDTNDGGT